MPEKKLDAESYKEAFRTLMPPLKLRKASPQILEVNKMFLAYFGKVTDNSKADAQKALGAWRSNISAACVDEVQRGADFIADLEFTLNTTDVIKAQVVRPPEPPAITLGIMTTYRGDERAADAIKVSGFDLWPAAKKTIENGLVRYFKEYVFDKYRDGGASSGSRAFADYARASKDRARPTISTALSDDCGGYDSGPIYKIQIDGLTEYLMTEDVMGCAVPWNAPLRLYMDKPTLAEATIVAVNLSLTTWEVVFMTKIDPKYIVKVKTRGGVFADL